MGCPHDEQVRCAAAGCDGVRAVVDLPTTAASGDGNDAFGTADPLDEGTVRNVEPHILQKFIPAGLGELHAGHTTDEGASLGATGGGEAGGTATGRGVGFLATMVWLPGDAGLPPSTGVGAGCGVAAGFTPSLGGSGAMEAIVFWGPGAGLASGNRPASDRGPISGMRQPQLWQKAEPSRTGRSHFGQVLEGDADMRRDAQGDWRSEWTMRRKLCYTAPL